MPEPLDRLSAIVKSLPGILKSIAERPLIFDGAMGTMIYQRGIFLNACYDELSLTQPMLIFGTWRSAGNTCGAFTPACSSSNSAPRPDKAWIDYLAKLAP